MMVAPPTVPLSRGGASLASLREIMTKRYLNIRGLSIPLARLSAPLTPFFVTYFIDYILK